MACSKSLRLLPVSPLATAFPQVRGLAPCGGSGPLERERLRMFPVREHSKIVAAYARPCLGFHVGRGTRVRGRDHMARARRQAVTPEIDAWIEHLPESFLGCRDMGHSWRPYTARFEASERRFRRVLRCSRCKTDRVQSLSTSGVIESTHYEYPDDYLAPKGAGVFDSAARAYVRLASVTHWLEAHEAKSA